MRLVTAPIDLNLNDAVRVPAGARVVMANVAAAALEKVLRLKARGNQQVMRCSGLAHYSHPYHGQDLNGKSILAWRGMGWGDQFVWAGLLRIIKRLYPEARIALLCNPRIYPFWHEAESELPFEVFYEPCSLSDWQGYDYHLVGEGLVEDDQEPDQPNIYDGHLAFAGIRPDGIPPEWKRPLVPLLPAWRNAAAVWLQQAGAPPPHPRRGNSSPRTSPLVFAAPRVHGAANGANDIEGSGESLTPRPPEASPRPLILWQLAASTPIRSYPPEQTRKALDLLATRLPNATIIVTGSPKEALARGLRPARPHRPGTPYLCIGEPFTTVLALVSMVDLVICPDSALGHAAAAFGRPCVSLWSSFHPAERVKYYPTHLPLYRPVNCGPCRAHERGPEAKGCPLARRGGSPYCRGLAAITPSQIVAAARAALSSSTSDLSDRSDSSDKSDIKKEQAS